MCHKFKVTTDMRISDVLLTETLFLVLSSTEIDFALGSGSVGASKGKKNKTAQKPQPVDELGTHRHHFNTTVLERLVKPKPENLKNLKWTAHEWKNVTKSETGTGGNWTKGYRLQGQWDGTNGDKGSWFSQGIVKGIWSLTEALGHWIMNQFWTGKSSAQVNVTHGHGLAAVFTSGNWSNGNLTFEAGSLDKFVNHSIPNGIEVVSE